MSNQEPKLFIPLELIYSILDASKAAFQNPAAAENLAMDFIKDNCQCGQVHTPDEIPQGIKEMADITIDSSISTVDMIRHAVEDAVLKGLTHGG